MTATTGTTEPSGWRRVTAPLRAVRTRIAAWVVLLTALALIGAGLAAYVVESDRIDDRVNEAIEQEIREFEQLNPRNYPSARAMLRAALSQSFPGEHELLAYFLDGEPEGKVNAAATDILDPVDQDFVDAVNAELPEGGSGRVETRGGPAVFAVKAVSDSTTQGAFVVAYFPDQEYAEFNGVIRTYAVVAGIALVLVSVGAWMAAGRLLQPLRTLRATAHEITDSDLSRRIEVSGNDDITDLSRTFNEMLDRLEKAFATQRRFLDDAGHELRTPVTIVRGHLELLDPDDPDDTRSTRSLVIDEVDRIGRLVDDLIVLAKAGQPDFLRPNAVDVVPLTIDIFDKVQTLGQRDWRLDTGAPGIVTVDQQRITQAVLQLAKHAIAHTEPGDPITIGSASTDHEVLWWVRDTGPGVMPADAERIFERFQRGHHARGAEGSGLGLSIVRAIAEGHGGDVRLDSTPGTGATFTLVVPLRTHHLPEGP
ncbi:MAG: HAMP domain-containing protein [Propionibacteriales bacterium]|nr:HAMP domain-containing protein [Propionibacteriales bacterium]